MEYLESLTGREYLALKLIIASTVETWILHTALPRRSAVVLNAKLRILTLARGSYLSLIYRTSMEQVHRGRGIFRNGPRYAVQRQRRQAQVGSTIQVTWGSIVEPSAPRKACAEIPVDPCE